MRVPRRPHPVGFVAQPTNYSPLGFEVQTKNNHSDFETQITKPQLPVLMTKQGNLSTLVLRPNQETHTPCLLMHGADHTQCQSTSRLSGHRVYDLCLTIPVPLHQVPYYCHDPRRYPPCRTCHLHTTKQENMILHTNQDKSKTTEISWIQIQIMPSQ
jgi:hypothetical protein